MGKSSVGRALPPAGSESRGGTDVAGDGYGIGPDSRQTRVGTYDTAAECTAAVRSEQPTANGVTFRALTTGLDTAGACYAEFNMTCHNGAGAWQTCMV